MNSSDKGDLILFTISFISIIIAVVSISFRNSDYNLNGKMVYIAAGAIPLCFIISTIMALVQGGRIKDAEDNKQMRLFRISSTVFFGLVPAIILVYLLYYYVSTDCNNMCYEKF